MADLIFVKYPDGSKGVLLVADGPFTREARPADVEAAGWTKPEAVENLRGCLNHLLAESRDQAAELSALRLEVAAWRALAEWSRVGDRCFFINMRGLFVASGDEEANGKTANSVVDLAREMKLIPPAPKPEAGDPL